MVSAERRARRVVAQDPNFLPAQYLRPTLWKPEGTGIWAHWEGILLLESRALLKVRSRMCHMSHGTSVWQLYLVDNMSVALSFERRRAHVHRLLVHIRPFVALCLFRDVFATVRWAPSEFNTSDARSRKYYPVDDASQSVLASLEEECTRNAKHRSLHTNGFDNVIQKPQTPHNKHPQATNNITTDTTNNTSNKHHMQQR